MCLHYYKSYYISVNEDIKSDHTCDIIDGVARSIERNMNYLCHYHFIDVTNFDFFGDNIVEATNCGLKRVDITVTTNMNIDTPLLTKIQMSKS